MLALLAEAKSNREIAGRVASSASPAGTKITGPAQGVTRLPLIVMQQQRIQGVTVGSVETLQAMVDAIAVNEMHPILDQVFSFENAKEAFAHMAAGRHFGKIAIAIP